MSSFGLKGSGCELKLISLKTEYLSIIINNKNETYSAPLNVYITPQKQTVNSGQSAKFNCFISGFPAGKVSWLKDGRSIDEISDPRRRVVNKTALIVDHLQRSDEGMYQCFVASDQEIQQAASLLLLGDVSPLITKHFGNLVLKPTDSLSLFCTVSGRPSPKVSWYVDGELVKDRMSYGSIQRYISPETTISYFNISNVKTEDSGNYKCQAENKAGIDFHSARINVYGKLDVKPLKNVTVVASRDLMLHCYVAGYPIKSIQWQTAGTIIKESERIKLYKNGTLLMQGIKKNQHEGRYTCVVRGRNGDISTGEVYVKVVVKPQISPMALPEHILEGMQVVIFCSVVRGDQPVKKIWLKDGNPIPLELGILIGDNPVYSALEIKSVESIHTGNFTCIASNIAGRTSTTVELLVESPPVWEIVPEDKLVYPGDDVRFDCKGGGTPKPISTWRRLVDGQFQDLHRSSRYTVVSNGSLVIRNLIDEDETTYICEIRNGLDPGISKRVKLQFGSQPHLGISSNSILSPSTKPVQIKCKARGAGKMNVTWLKDGVPLSIAENRFSISEMRVGTTRTSKVIILKPVLSDTGLYTCILSSTFGKERRNIKVKIIEPPSPIQNIQVKVNDSLWKLRWENSDTSIKTSWYIVQYKNKSESWNGDMKSIEVLKPEITLKNIPPDAKLVFRVYGVNEVGRGEQKEFVYSAPTKQSGVMMLDAPVMSHSNHKTPKIPLLLIIVPVITAIMALFLILIVVYIIRRKEETVIEENKTISRDDQFTLRSIGVKESDNPDNHRQTKYSNSDESHCHSRYGPLHRNDYYSNSGEYITPYATFPPQDLKMIAGNSKLNHGQRSDV